MEEIIKRMQDRIMQHQNENGFETIFDFLNEDLDDLEQQLKILNIPVVSNNEVAVCPKCGYDEIFSFHGSNTCLNKECDWAN